MYYVYVVRVCVGVVIDAPLHVFFNKCTRVMCT